MNIEQVSKNPNSLIIADEQCVFNAMQNITDFFKKTADCIVDFATKAFEFISENWATILLSTTIAVALCTVSWVLLPSDLILFGFGAAAACVSQLFAFIIQSKAQDFHNVAQTGIALATITFTLLSASTGALLTSLIGLGYMGARQLLKAIDC